MACPYCGSKRRSKSRTVRGLLMDVANELAQEQAAKQRMLDLILEDYEVKDERGVKTRCGDVYRSVAAKLNKSVSIRIVRDVQAALELIPKERRVHRFNCGGPKYFRHLAPRKKPEPGE